MDVDVDVDVDVLGIEIPRAPCWIPRRFARCDTRG
jgi:hypothetical protein